MHLCRGEVVLSAVDSLLGYPETVSSCLPDSLNYVNRPNGLPPRDPPASGYNLGRQGLLTAPLSLTALFITILVIRSTYLQVISRTFGYWLVSLFRLKGEVPRLREGSFFPHYAKETNQIDQDELIAIGNYVKGDIIDKEFWYSYVKGDITDKFWYYYITEFVTDKFGYNYVTGDITDIYESERWSTCFT